MSDLLAIAQREISRGYKVIICTGKLPSIPKDKGGHGAADATDNIEVVKEWLRQYPQATGIAIVAGKHTFLDIDLKNLPLLDKWQKEHGIIETACKPTPGGGWHFSFIMPEGIGLHNIASTYGFELKVENQYIMAGGSLHPDTGKLYPDWNETEPQPMPEWLARICVATGRTPEAKTIKPLSSGSRHTDLISHIGRLRALGTKNVEIVTLALALNHDTTTPLPDGEVIKMVGEYAHQEKQGHYNLTDIGNAERLVKDHKEILHYSKEYERWLVFTGKCWEWDMGLRVSALAKATVRNIYTEAANEPDERTRKEISNHAKASESNAKIEGMLSRAKSEYGVAVKLSELNSNRWLLNCQNGTLDLQTGELKEHDSKDLITYLIPTNYEPNAECPNWLSFLEWLTSGDKENQQFIKKSVGYSLTGMTSAQVIFLLYGLGGNGKSTFLNTIKSLLDGYAGRLDAEDLMVSDRNSSKGQAKEGIADLQGKRFVVGSEIADNRQLNTSLIKDISGQDTVKARRLYAHDTEFMPECKIWLYGNHKPDIRDTTISTWRRIKLIPCNGTLPESKKIEDYQERYLTPELPGILAWAVTGCLDWQKEGLKDSQTIKVATNSYRTDEDILGDFLEDYCILEPTAGIGKKELKDLYIKWLEDTKADAIHSQKTFKKRLLEKGIIDGFNSDGTKRLWRGIRAKTPLDNQLGNVRTDKIIEANLQNKSDFPKLSLENSHIEKLQENPIILSETSETSENTNLPNCTSCGLTEWAFSPDGKFLLCPCGHKEGVQ